MFPFADTIPNMPSAGHPNPIFDPYPHTLRSLVSDQWPLVVDEYQRDYAWESGEVDDFIHDVGRLHGKVRDGDEDASHFFGALVAIEHRRLPSYDRAQYSVVDGQQRLTTFSLAMAGVLERARELRQELLSVEVAEFLNRFVSDMRLRYVEQSESHKQTFRKRSIPVFSVTDRDEPLFRQLMTGASVNTVDPEERYSTALMQQAYETILEELIRPFSSQPSPEECVRALVHFASTLEERCEFIFISTQSRVRATQLFSVLNDRGRSLEQSDLLRTHTAMLVENAGEADRESVRRSWDEVDRHSRLKVDGFLRHHFASVVGRRVSGKQVFAQYKTDFGLDFDEPLAGDVTKVVAFAVRLREGMSWYVPMSDGLWPFSGAASRWDQDRLRRIVEVLRSERVLPLLLAAASRGEEALAALVVPLERLEFRAIVAGVEQNQMANMYFDVAALLRHQQLDVSGALREVGKWVRVWSSDEAFAQGISEKLVYGVGQGTGFIKHLLTSIDDHLAWLQGGATWPPKPVKTSVWDFGAIHDEHVYPQNPEAGLPLEVAPLLHRLGNQTFLSANDNVGVSNLLPTDPRKYEVYMTSEVALTRELGETLSRRSVWGEQEIREREVWLVEASQRIFSFDPGLPDAAGSGGRRALFNRRTDSEPRVWLVLSKPGSRYDDRPGLQYHYPSRIPNGRQITEGDVLVVFRPKAGSRPAEVTGVGLIDHVEHLDDDTRLAIYSQYIAVPEMIAISEPLGAEPRANLRNAMNRLGLAYLQALDSLVAGRLQALIASGFGSLSAGSETA